MNYFEGDKIDANLFKIYSAVLELGNEFIWQTVYVSVALFWYKTLLGTTTFWPTLL